MLPAAGFIQLEYEVRLVGVEVRGRVVERQVAVLPDAAEADRHGVVGDDAAHALGLGLGVVLGVEVVERRDGVGQLAVEAFPEVLPEARGVGDGQADVFVEVEHGDAVPVEVGLGDQGLEHLELGSAGGDDDAGLAVSVEGVAELGGSVGGRGAAHGGLVVEGVEFHGVGVTRIQGLLFYKIDQFDMVGPGRVPELD